MADNFFAQNHQQDPNIDHELDQQLDRALASYLPPPPAGLEQRILARTQSITPRHAWLQPRFAFLAASVVAACALAAIFLVMPSRVSVPHDVPHSANAVATKITEPLSHKTAPAQPTRTSLATLTTKPAIHRVPHRITHAPSESNLPRLAVFPAPAPPTPQEEELAMFAARYPKLLEEAFKPMPRAKPEPIVIQPIQIKPLTITPLSIAKLNPQPNTLPHHPENAQ